MRLVGILFVMLWTQLSMAQVTASPVLAMPNAQSEKALINFPFGTHLNKLLIWDDATTTWRTPRLQETIPQTPVLVLHVWADYCKPCLREFPILRDFAAQVETDYPGKVQFLYVTLTESQSDLRAFLLKHHDTLPKAAQYTDPTLQEDLEHVLVGSLSLPATFVLDSHRQARVAVLGSLAHRRVQLGRVITQLLTATQQPLSSP
jgi:thiol-disulfide isomerase/thioredoxin